MQPNWEERYRDHQTGWDIGSISTPLKEYFDQIENKEIKILIPGCGNAYEADYLWNKGFKNVYLLDIASSPLLNFAKKNPSFPKDQLIQEDFFNYHETFDLIIEQTFFCAIEPELRQAYSDHSIKLLKTGGKLVGLFWSTELNEDHPPYGGSKEEYLRYFEPYFEMITFEESYNSIAPRSGRELFAILRKK